MANRYQGKAKNVTQDDYPTVDDPFGLGEGSNPCVPRGSLHYDDFYDNMGTVRGKGAARRGLQYDKGTDGLKVTKGRGN